MFSKALEDATSGKFLAMALVPFFVPIILLGGFFIYGGSELFSMLSQGAQSGDFSFLDEQAYPTLSYILSFSVVHWLIVALFAVIGTFGVVLFSVVIAVVVVGFLTPMIVGSVRKRHYEHIQKAQAEPFLKTLVSMLKAFGVFLLLLLVAIPMLFIPILNIFALQVPFIYLFYKLMLVDMLSVGISSQTESLAKKHKTQLRVTLGVFYFLSLIPFLGLFLQVFYVTYLSHFFFSKSS